MCVAAPCLCLCVCAAAPCSHTLVAGVDSVFIRVDAFSRRPRLSAAAEGGGHVVPGAAPRTAPEEAPDPRLCSSEKQTKFTRARATRSSAQGNCSAKSLVASVMLSILPCSSILPSPPCLPPVMLSVGGAAAWGVRPQGVWVGGGLGGGGRGHFIHIAIHCTTTWCFALKGLRTKF